MKAINFKNIAIIIIVSSALGFIYNAIRKDSIPLLRVQKGIEFIDEIPIDEISTGAALDLQLKGIKLETAYRLFLSENATFIDARDQWDFAEAHIRGAINIPEFSFDPNDSNINDLDKQASYIIYCSGDDCDTSKRLAEELMKLNFENILIYVGGFLEWQSAGYPIGFGGNDD